VSRSRQRALGAALDLVAERGIAGATIEAISARSGVAKTTVYRQWPNQAALVLDAFRSVTPDPPLPDTGTLRGDLLVLVAGLAEALGRGRSAVLMAALIDAAQRDPDFARLHAEESLRRRQAVLAVLGRGVERGELAADSDPESLVDRLAGPVFHRRFITGLPLDRDFGERLVDAVLNAPSPAATTGGL
jgi:AcrR family transcriptional regulator